MSERMDLTTIGIKYGEFAATECKELEPGQTATVIAQDGARLNVKCEAKNSSYDVSGGKDQAGPSGPSIDDEEVR